MRKIKQTKKAFTLIETLLYISLTSIILISITAFVGTLLSTRLRNQALSEVDQQAVQLMQYLTYTIKEAEGINSPTAGNVASTLSLDVVTPTDDPTIISLNSGTARVQEGGGPFINLNSNLVTISNLTFRNLSPSANTETIRIQFTVTYNNPSGRQEGEITRTYYGSATLR